MAIVLWREDVQVQGFSEELSLQFANPQKGK